MQSIKLSNQTNSDALFLVTRGNPTPDPSTGMATVLTGQIGVEAGASAIVQTGDDYSVSASATENDGTIYESAAVSSNALSQTVTAEFRGGSGLDTFALLLGAGTALETITLSNLCKYDVEFSMHWNDLAGTITVKPLESASLSIRTFSFAADVDGVVTDPITSSQGAIEVAVQGQRGQYQLVLVEP